jgi:predicted dehydrogenase
MEHQPLRVGVIGVGHLGLAHAKNYQRIPGVQLAGIHDTNARRAEEKARELGCRSFAHIEDLLGDVQAVSVVVPTEYHHEVGMKVLDRKLHVLMEKPIARTVEEADHMVRLAGEKGVVFQIGHIERYNPVVERGSELVDHPLFIECHRLAPFKPRGTDVDVILDLMIHDIDLILKFTGSEVHSISAVGIPVISGKIDIANARLVFRNHAVANITASRISREVVRKMRIFQRNTYISLDFHRRALEVVRLIKKNGGTPHVDSQDSFFSMDRRVIEEAEPLKAELTSFIESIRTGKRPGVTGEDGRNALLVASRILEEIHTTSLDP